MTAAPLHSQPCLPVQIPREMRCGGPWRHFHVRGYFQPSCSSEDSLRIIRVRARPFAVGAVAHCGITGLVAACVRAFAPWS
jgi:hypothetical protein